MSFEAMAWAVKQRCASTGQKMVLLMIANYANDDGVCWPRKQTLADACCMSKSAVCDNINRLKDAGLITVEERGGEPGEGRQRSSLIHLHMEGPPVGQEVSGNRTAGVQLSDTSGVRLSDSYKKNLSEDNQSSEPITGGIDEEFSEFWAAYPKRTPHSNPRAPALTKYRHARQRLLVSHETLVNAAKAYAAKMKGDDPKFVVQTTRWFNERRWEETAEPAAPEADVSSSAIVQAVREIAGHYPGILDQGATAEVAALVRNGEKIGVLVEAAEKYKLWVKFQQSEGFNLQPPTLSTWLKFRWRDMDNYQFCYRGSTNRKSVKLKKGTGE